MSRAWTTGSLATEPFSEWVLEGVFKGYRPAWDTAGAKFTDDVVPHDCASCGCSTAHIR